MAINIRETLKYGNISKKVDIAILPNTVWCPICEQYVDGIVNTNDLEAIEPECNCDIEGHITFEEHNEVLNARDDTIASHEQDINILEKEVARLEWELMNAKQS